MDWFDVERDATHEWLDEREIAFLLADDAAEREYEFAGNTDFPIPADILADCAPSDIPLDMADVPF